MVEMLAAESVGAGRLAWALVVTVLACLPLGISLWALLDAARRPQWAWALSSHHQVVWMAVIMFSVLTVIGGLAVSAWYLLRVRPDVAAIEAGELDLE